MNAFEAEFNNGHGFFSRWDSFRADTKMDTCGIIWKNNKQLFRNVNS